MQHQHGMRNDNNNSMQARLKKRACNCTPSKIQTVPKKIVTVSTVSIGAKPAKFIKYSINYNRFEFC